MNFINPSIKSNMFCCLYIFVWKFEMNPIVNILEFDIECAKNLGKLT